MAERSQLSRRILAIVAAAPARTGLSRRRSALLAAGAGAALLAVACATTGGPARPPETSASAPSPAAAGGTSTLDPRLQRIAEEELDRTMAEWKGEAGAVVVLEPATGEILANAGRAHGAPADVGVQRVYVTGSTLKGITLAAALDDGVVSAGDRFDCENGAFTYAGHTMHDSHASGTLTLPEMLAVSTNVGFTKVFDRMGGDRLGRWLRRFHFGAAPAVAGAAPGEVPARIEDRSFEGAMAAIGEAMKASPLQVAAAYATLANDGAYVAPTLSRRAGPPPREPLLKPDTARAVVAMLETAVTSEHSTGKQARLEGTRVAGKTGTASWPLPGGGEGIYASFVGIVPADHPRFVILVGVEAPREGGYGGTVAAPAFARVAARALQAGGT
jgi:cell division protein FtsI (penicillin-binding protein 3)